MSTSCATPTRLPPSFSLIAAVRQLCLGGSHSIVLAPPSLIGAYLGAALPTLWKGLAPSHCDTWHLGTLSRLCFELSLSFLPGQSLQQSAADGRHLVSAALKPNCRTQSQVFASVSLLQLLCWSRANPACTQLLDAFYPCTHLELLAVLALMFAMEPADTVITISLKMYTQ